MKNLVKRDFIFRPTEDGKYKECKICGIVSFSHFHKKGSLPKDFEKIEGAFDLLNIKQAAKYSNLSQAIQMIVWQYMSLPKRERDGVEMADKIIKLIKK